jgi:hypothetical protein
LPAHTHNTNAGKHYYYHYLHDVDQTPHQLRGDVRGERRRRRRRHGAVVVS